ncbi:MAG: fumarylacetoacetate hydrolase family protein [Planctomycetota bacterium]
MRHDHCLAVEVDATRRLPIVQIIGVGLNYVGHAREQGVPIPERPLLFTKNPAAACLHGDSIVVPKLCQDRDQVDYEGELAVLIGKPARDVPVEHALDFVLGYCCANDVSARWWQKEGSGRQFFRGKSFDTFCPLGPGVVPAGEVGDPNALRLRTTVNGETCQEAHTSNMIFSVSQLISEISRGLTLVPGTVILTGTPAGVGFARTPPRFLRDGDVVRVEIDKLGVLENGVRFE